VLDVQDTVPDQRVRTAEVCNFPPRYASVRFAERALPALRSVMIIAKKKSNKHGKSITKEIFSDKI
jgi:hypothetical protein